MAERQQSYLAFLSSLLGLAVVAELVLLRTGTRALIHIPGLGQFETPIRALAEAGRFSYYLAVVLLLVTLAYMAYRGLRRHDPARRVTGALVIVFLGLALGARVDLISSALGGFASLGVLVAVTVFTWRGIRWLPVGLFMLASTAASWSVFGQGAGGGLSGAQVDWLVIAAEASLLLAAVTSPMLADNRLTFPSVLAGVIAFTLTVGALSSAGSTLSILVLWNVGVPGWLPGIAYAVAIGGLVTALWLSLSTGRRITAIGLVLLLAGGVGAISTYQTGLVLAGILLLDSAQRVEIRRPVMTTASGERSDREEENAIEEEHLGRTPAPVA